MHPDLKALKDASGELHAHLTAVEQGATPFDWKSLIPMAVTVLEAIGKAIPNPTWQLVLAATVSILKNFGPAPAPAGVAQ